MHGTEKAAKVMGRVWSQLERKLDEKQGKEALHPDYLLFSTLACSPQPVFILPSGTFMCFHGSMPWQGIEGIRRLGLKSGPEALFHRLQCFHYDPTVSSELKPSANCTHSLCNEVGLTSVGAP